MSEQRTYLISQSYASQSEVADISVELFAVSYSNLFIKIPKNYILQSMRADKVILFNVDCIRKLLVVGLVVC